MSSSFVLRKGSLDSLTSSAVETPRLPQHDLAPGLDRIEGHIISTEDEIPIPLNSLFSNVEAQAKPLTVNREELFRYMAQPLLIAFANRVWFRL